MSSGKKFHQTGLGNILCAAIGIGIAAFIVFVLFSK